VFVPCKFSCAGIKFVKLFSYVTDAAAKYARVFVPGKLFWAGIKLKKYFVTDGAAK
jgi:hypothetical protein